MSTAEYSSENRLNFPTKRPRRSTVLWALGAFALIMGALLVPDAWIKPIERLYNVEQPREDVFSPGTAALSRALEDGDPLATSPTRLRDELPNIQARRLLDAGPMTGEEVGEAVELFREFQARIAVEKSEGSREAVRKFRNGKLLEIAPRLDPDKVPRELAALRRQIELASFRELETRTPEDCAGCHSESVASPLEEPLDLRYHWPNTGVENNLSDDALPALMSPHEIFEWARRTGEEAPACTSCHTTHDDPQFGVTLEERRKNMGLWVNVYRIREVLYIQAKVKNQGAAHRAPSGYPGHAYALVVEARNGDSQSAPLLDYWLGEKLPEELQVDGVESGTLFMRHLVDAAGERTSQHSKAVAILSDNRIESDRFVDLRYLFNLGNADMDTYIPWWVRVRLVYLPDSMSWRGAQDVEIRIEQSASK